MKQLISAETIRQEHAAGKRKLDVALPNTIVTAEARSVADQLGVALVEVAATTPPRKGWSGADTPCAKTQAAAGKPSADEIAAIRGVWGRYYHCGIDLLPPSQFKGAYPRLYFSSEDGYRTNRQCRCAAMVLSFALSDIPPNIPPAG